MEVHIISLACSEIGYL